MFKLKCSKYTYHTYSPITYSRKCFVFVCLLVCCLFGGGIKCGTIRCLWHLNQWKINISSYILMKTFCFGSSTIKEKDASFCKQNTPKLLLYFRQTTAESLYFHYLLASIASKLKVQTLHKTMTCLTAYMSNNRTWWIFLFYCWTLLANLLKAALKLSVLSNTGLNINSWSFA